MSSFRKALKSQQRNHHERSQPGFRKNLGLLEKKKDYKLRADDYHKKQKTLAALRKKALDKNPDEFYFNMISSQLQDGVHVAKKDKEEMMTEEQKKVMRTQDIKYVEMKRVAEAKSVIFREGLMYLIQVLIENSSDRCSGCQSLLIIYFQKIERLKGELHLLDADGKQNNKHTFFVDSAKEVHNFDLANHLQTAPELVNRVYNRPTLETLERKSVQGDVNPRSIMKLARIRKHQYKILSQRIDREKKMFVIAQKIQTRKDMQDKNKKVKVKKETQTTAAIYKFEAKRKR